MHQATAIAPITVAVSGSTGLIGKTLSQALREQGHTAVPIVRKPPAKAERAIYWDQDANSLDATAIQGIDAVIHLAGESIVGRWTPAKRKRILESRVNSTALIARTIAALPDKPRVMVSASAVGIFGDRGDTPLDDTAPSGKAGEGFLQQVCEQWEAAADPARAAGIRVVHPRIGMVLARDGGALPTMLTPFRFGLGGTLGDGSQWIGWLHLDDLVQILITCLHNTHLAGPVNAVAPNPVTNRELTKTLGRALHRPTILPVPRFGARLAFGNLADELLLASQRVVPRKLEAAGFTWQHPKLESALRDLLQTKETA